MSEQNEIKVLDVTEIEPREKHPTIFEWFNRLNHGESFIIYNDHDPRPLYYQLQAEIPGAFGWEYVEEGPQVFQVKVTRLGEGTLGFGGSCCS
ncbi:MAG: hemerythrin [Spirochaetaceae bacterium]|nr:hemerythrin [Spirochaetaceae bacterium]|tara:strand:- start:1871 stop:2149 length:279 start_codon:yes stop_codon:yes gene_type:complete